MADLAEADWAVGLASRKRQIQVPLLVDQQRSYLTRPRRQEPVQKTWRSNHQFWQERLCPAVEQAGGDGGEERRCEDWRGGGDELPEHHHCQIIQGPY